MNFYERCGKRLLDFAAALLLLILLSPVLGITALLVRWKIGCPVLFVQMRPGKGERIFRMCKFRTMTNEVDAEGRLLPDEKRLTGFGKFLRSTSLDELPELWNILKGDMSFVGPRPQLVRDMVFMNEKQRIRHTVRQGLTGLAQINGRNAVSWEKKFLFDLQYVEHMNVWQDMKITGATIIQVFRREGISAEGMETAEDFGDYLLRTNQVTEEEYEKKQQEAEGLLKEMENRT